MAKLIERYRRAEIYKMPEGYFWKGYGTEEGYYPTLKEAREAIDSMGESR